MRAGWLTMASPASKTWWYFSICSLGNSKTAAMVMVDLLGSGLMALTDALPRAGAAHGWNLPIVGSALGAGEPGQAGPVRRAELGQQRGDVLFHRARRQDEAFGDLAIGQPVGAEVEHLGPTAGEAEGGQRGGQGCSGRPPARRGVAGRLEQRAAGGRGAAEAQFGERGVGGAQPGLRSSPVITERGLGDESLDQGGEDRIAMAGDQGRGG